MLSICLQNFRDCTESAKELTPEEKREISVKESTRLNRISGTSAYSPRRERGLKIYTDVTPTQS